MMLLVLVLLFRFGGRQLPSPTTATLRGPPRGRYRTSAFSRRPMPVDVATPGLKAASRGGLDAGSSAEAPPLSLQEQRLKRFITLAELIPPGSPAADIGCDHGLLAAHLVHSGRCPNAIAIDRSSSSCEAARSTVERFALSHAVDVRQGDGLTALSAGEVDTVCVAGMGVGGILDILKGPPQADSDPLSREDSLLRSLRIRTLVVQPQTPRLGSLYALRRWLQVHQWPINEERLVVIGKRLYVTIKAVATQPRAVDRDAVLSADIERELLLGRAQWESDRDNDGIRHRYHRYLVNQRTVLARQVADPRWQSEQKQRWMAILDDAIRSPTMSPSMPLD
ncbi:unnamed protein product [Vitrella brassicaformis CCMP3155]|uniref:Methyltransferase domain-containing protein n=2 Tax=Vitrella brassicaformis TaxID=1169539 RepID=A0A0G4FDX8_VITBC|nr:unnamed protein product [Vitrella brassicaformis CCMP3155]|eukprot:CEM11380.1 unnamed protein product [Vitrella brassicaformis CCMP3155]